MALTQVLFAAAIFAHLPSISDDDYGDFNDAFELDDVDKSIVLYDTVSCEVPEVWLTFVTQEPDKPVFVQLGVPVIDRLADYRPALALLAPGLPEIDLPFDVPTGVGGVRFDAADADAPSMFFEPFTMTSSWIWYEGTVVVPEPGRGWVVAWDPSGRTGKLWVAIGTVEDFSGGVDVTFEQIWAYHETNGFEPETEVVEQQCDEDSGDEPSADEGAAPDGCSCGVDEPGRDALPAMLGLGAFAWLLGRRRRRLALR